MKAEDYMKNPDNYFEWEKVKLVHELNSKVEEMQKTLEWYADEENYGTGILSKHGFIPIDNDSGERARQALKGVTHE